MCLKRGLSHFKRGSESGKGVETSIKGLDGNIRDWMLSEEFGVSTERIRCVPKQI